jgi:carboxypeptidase Taq
MRSETTADANPEGNGSVDDEAYEDLLERYDELFQLDCIENVLFWDQQVMMPDGGTPARSEQRGTLSSIRHRLLTAPETGAAIARIDEDRLNGVGRANVRELKREYDRATSVDDDLQRELSQTVSAANDSWTEARKNDDFDAFASDLRKLVELKREYATAVDPDEQPFTVLYDEYEPYLSIDVAERVLDRLRDRLVPLIKEIKESDVTPGVGVFDGTYDADAQMALSQAALDYVELDRSRGRLDVSPHPFAYGNRYDVRITTRFDEARPVDALTSTLHEFGHTAYNHGLPEEHFGEPVGTARSHGVHESQSRFFENHVCRSMAFWEGFTETMHDHLPGTEGVTPEEAYAAANRIYEDNMIRVEADEVTYHMHILLRFEVERDLVNGDIDVEEVPDVWNDRMERYLGVRPETDGEGCLQDIHWSLGRIGTFQNYTVGTVLAAQLEHAMEADIGPIDDRVRKGEFGDIHRWLVENVQGHGSRYETDELIREATGEFLSADYFLDHVESKYTDLYDL